MLRWLDFLVSPTDTLVHAARVIDSGGGQIAVVADEQRRLLGTITDADLREALLTGRNFNDPCSEFMSRNPISLPKGSTRDDCRTIMVKRHIGQLPLIDDKGVIVDVVLMTELYLPENQPNAVVIMAGGLGSRLKELTSRTPKPLLNVGGRPLLETIIDQAAQQGFSRFYLSVNYKADMIIKHFGDGSQLGIDIRYIRETKRLGTAGALHLMKEEFNDDIIVMNGDILSKVDLRRLLLFHRRAKAVATMAVKDFDLQVPYGVVGIDDRNRIVSLTEKPNQRYFINAGIYALSPDVLSRIPHDEFFDMPSLFHSCGDAKMNICAYPLREYWIDIGHIEDFERANFEFHYHFKGNADS